MKKQLLNLTMLLIVLLMGGGSALGAEKEIASWDFTKLSTATGTDLVNLTSKGDYAKVGQSGWSYASQYVSEFEGIAFARLRSNSRAYGFAYRGKALFCQNNAYAMTIVSLKKNYVVTIVASNKGIQESFVGNKGAETIEKTEDNKTYTYTLKTDGDLNVLVNGSAYIYSIKVVEPEVASTYVDYTVNYLYNNEIIKKTTASSIVGDIIKAESPTTIESQKYYFADGATTSLTISSNADENVLNVNLRKANVYAYTVTNSFGTKLAEGNGIEGESVSGNYVKYFNVDGTLYEGPQQDKNTGYYKYSFVPDKEGYNYNITYKKTEISNVVYYSEAENIDGMTETNAINAGIRCSNGKGGYSSDAVTLATLQPGKYVVYTNVWGNKDQSFTVKAGETTIHTTTTTGALSPSNSEVFEITSPTAVTVQGGNGNSMLDYIYIVKTADVLPLSTDYKLSTYAPATDVDLTNEAGVKFYAAKVNGTSVTLTEVTGKVKAGTGLVVENNNSAESVSLATATDGQEVTNNDLVGVTEDMTGDDFDGKNAYVLVSDTKFQKVDATTQGTLAKGKAYLLAGGTAAARLLTIGNPTAINGVAEKAAEAADAIYNIQGMRVDKADASGLYIIGGKKYIKK